MAVARQNSPLLRDLALQVGQNRLDSLRRKAQNGPQVNGTGAAVYFPSLTNRNGEAVLGYDQAVTNGGSYAAVAQVSKPIFNRPVVQNDYQLFANQGLALRNTRALGRVGLPGQGHSARHHGRLRAAPGARARPGRGPDRVSGANQGEPSAAPRPAHRRPSTSPRP